VHGYIASRLRLGRDGLAVAAANNNANNSRATLLLPLPCCLRHVCCAALNWCGSKRLTMTVDAAPAPTATVCLSKTPDVLQIEPLAQSAAFTGQCLRRVLRAAAG